MVKLKYYAKNYYRSPYRRKFNYQIFGDMYCFCFKDRLKKVLENPIWYAKIAFGDERRTIINYYKRSKQYNKMKHYIKDIFHLNQNTIARSTNRLVEAKK